MGRFRFRKRQDITTRYAIISLLQTIKVNLETSYSLVTGLVLKITNAPMGRPFPESYVGVLSALCAIFFLQIQFNASQ